MTLADSWCGPFSSTVARCCCCCCCTIRLEYSLRDTAFGENERDAEAVLEGGISEAGGKAGSGLLRLEEDRNELCAPHASRLTVDILVILRRALAFRF